MGFVSLVSLFFLVIGLILHIYISSFNSWHDPNLSVTHEFYALVSEDFILESVVEGEMDNVGVRESETHAGGVRELRLPLGLYHDRLHNVYIAAGTLGAAIAIVGVVVSTDMLYIQYCPVLVCYRT